MDRSRVDPPVRPVLVPGPGLDERPSTRLRELVPADVVLLPGTGLAGPVPPLEELAAALCARLGEGPVLPVGHSQGGQEEHPVPLTARGVAAVAEAAPQGRLVEIPGAAQLTPMTHHGPVAALVRAAAGSAGPGQRRTAT